MKKLLTTLFALCSVIALSLPALALKLDAKAYTVYAPAYNQWLVSHNADEQIGPASLTKMMTLYLLFEAIDRGDLSLEQELPISEAAWRKGGSKMFLEVGKTVKVADLIPGIAAISGNDACLVVAEYMAGTEESFAELMNSKAQELGMTNSNFMNASGWPNPEQYTTAHDMALLAHRLRSDFPHHADVFSQREFSYSNIRQFNRNGLLRRNIGVDGMKTGHIEDAGYHLVSSAMQRDLRLYVAVLGTGSQAAREQQSMAALRYSYGRYEPLTLATNGQVLETVAVPDGLPNQVELAVAEDVVQLIDRRKQTYQTSVSYTLPPAPLQAGQVVGEARFETSEGTFTTPLVVSANIAKAPWYEMLLRRVTGKAGQ